MTAVVTLGGTVASLQFTLIIPLLPELPHLLGVSEENASWLVTVTLVTGAVATPIVSRAADMYGKRRMLLIALAVLSVGSWICAVESSLAAMLVGRAFQGFGSSLIAVGISLLRDELPREKISSAVALMSATLGIGSALGLPLAGIFAEVVAWHAVFWFSAMAGLALIVGVVLLVPESTVRTPGCFDLLGALLLSVALVALLLAITKGSRWGWTSAAVLELVVLGVCVLAVWFPVELRVNQPMVDLRTAASRPVLLTNSASFFVGFAMFANMLLTTRELQLPVASGSGLGLSVLETGVAMVPSGLAMVAISPLTGRMLKRWGGRRALMFGTAIMTATYIARVFFSGSLAEVMIGFMLVGIGAAIAFASLPTLIMASVPITETASANGINSLVRSIGTALASAAIVMVLTATATTFDGEAIASVAGLHLTAWLAAVATVSALALASFIPSADTIASTQDEPLERHEEIVIRGRVVGRDPGSFATPALVTVFDLGGTQRDWARADHDGYYSVALPGPGRYVLVANAQGWAPAAHVCDLSGAILEQLLELSRQLTLSGTVTCKGVPSPDAVVTLSTAEGQHVTTGRCDPAGRYCLPLPPIGLYLLTAIEPRTASATAYKTVLTLQSKIVDLELVDSAQ